VPQGPHPARPARDKLVDTRLPGRSTVLNA
jgi:hypothetical protein